MRRLTKMYISNLTYEIIGAAIEVHKELGPGLLEKIYEACMIHELTLRGINVKSQKDFPVMYKGFELDAQLRFDLLVENCIVIELKSVAQLIPLFDAQAMSYARIMEIPKAILINFNCNNIFNEGQKTFVNQYYKMLPDK